MKSISLFSLIFFLSAYQAQQGTVLKDNVTLDAVEGKSKNVKILCTLDKEQPEPLYWLINKNLYDSYNLPRIFTSVTYGALTLASVNRRMDGWKIQCIRVTSNKELRHGETTSLHVLYDADTPDTNTSSSLEPSHLGRIIINYHDTNIDVDKTTISWLYYPVHNSPCAKSNYYELGLYSRTGSGDLQYLNSLDSMEESITFDCPNLISPNNETMIYFNITVLSNNNDSCATTEYLQTLSGQENHTVIFADGNSSSFGIPSEFIDSPIQLIWSTDGVTQCVCPLVEELIPKCACNGNNTLSLSNNTITISRSEEVHSLVIYLVNSTLTSSFNVRSIEKSYRVIFDQGPGPKEPVVAYDRINRAVCFNETSDPVHSIHYQAIIKIHGVPLWTSEAVQGSQCIKVPMELYRNVSCQSFSLVFIAIDEFGDEIHNIRQNIDSENVTIQVYSITSDSYSVTLDCSGSDSILELTLTQTDEIDMPPKYNTTSCNTTENFNSLHSGTNYTLNVDRVFHKIICPLITRQFITKDLNTNNPTEIVVVERVSTNVNIICGLDRIDNPPLYWVINQSMYDTSNLPYIFKTTAYGTLTLETVDRRMDGWEIQCVRVTVEELIRGQMATLRVIYDPITTNPTTSNNLEPSYLGRIILNHQDIHIGANETFISWSYDPDNDSPCAESRYYEFGRYSRTGSGDILYIESIDSMKENITIDSSLLYSSNDALIYFNVSVLARDSGEACATTEYLQTFSVLDTHDHTVIFANGKSTYFEIPAEFKDSSMELIWSTDEFTQCICPLVEELLEICSCNSILSLSNSSITISKVEGMDYLVVYLANSTLISCCNVRSVERMYRVFFEGSGPEELTVSYNREDRHFCTFYHSANDPKYPITYRATITTYSDHIIWTSEKLLTPECIDIPEEFHHIILCSPFNLTLYLMDSFEEEIQRKQLEINLDNITVLVDSITDNSINVTLNCYVSEYNRDSSALSLTLMQGGKTIFQNMTHCNTTNRYEDLQSGKNYTLLLNRDFNSILCELSRSQFKTETSTGRGLLVEEIIIIVMIMIFAAVIVVVTIIIMVVKIRRKGTINTLDSYTC